MNWEIKNLMCDIEVVKEKLEDVFVGSENEINKHNKIHKYLRKVDSMKPDRFASPLISGNIFAIEPQHR